jgi:glutamyl-tRNA reductase
MNHKTASVAIRERLAFDTQASLDALQKFKAAYPECEFVLLSTCNRVECYVAAPVSRGLNPTELAMFLSNLKNVDYPSIQSCFYTIINDDAVRHLLTVGAGLDSMVIGENQIIAQVKESYRLACQADCSGKILNHLFHIAFHTTKNIISSTSISSRRVSVAGVAVDLAKRLLTDIQSARIVVAGAGHMGELIVEHFKHIQCQNIVIVNRTFHRGCQAAQQHHTQYKSWEALDQEIAEADIVIGAATAQDGYLFNREQFEHITSRRPNKPLLIIDITVPRSFDPAIRNINGVHLYSIDDLGQTAQDNIKLREGDLEQAIEIICAHTAEFMEWFETREIGPLISQVKDAFERAKDDAELQAADSEVNQSLHSVVTSIREIAKQRGVAEAERFAQQIVACAGDILRNGGCRQMGDS